MSNVDNADERLLTVYDVAERLGMQLMAVRDWIRDGIFPAPDAVDYRRGTYFWKEATVQPWCEWRARVLDLRAKRAEVDKQAKELREYRASLESANRDAWQWRTAGFKSPAAFAEAKAIAV